MKVVYKNADFSANGIGTDVIELQKDRLYVDVICNFSQDNAVAMSGFSSVFYKIPLSADKMYFSGSIKGVGLAIVDNVVYGDELATYTNVQKNIIPSSSELVTYEDEEIDVSQYQGKWILWSWDNAQVSSLSLKYDF